MRMRRRISPAVPCGVLAVLCAVCVVGADALKGDYFNFVSSHPPNTIRIEGTMGLTPPDAAYEGIELARGVFFWAQRVNTLLGGIDVGGAKMNVSVVLADDGFDATFAATYLSGLCMRPNATRPHIIVLPFSAVAAAPATLAAMRLGCKVPLLTMGFFPDNLLVDAAKANITIVTTAPPRIQGQTLLSNLVTRLVPNPRMALVLKADDPFSANLAANTIARINSTSNTSGTRLVAAVSYMDSSTRLSLFLRLLEIVDEVKAVDPDVLIFYGLFSDTVTVMEACRMRGVKPKAFIATTLYPTHDTAINGENWSGLALYNPLYSSGVSGVGMGTTQEACADYLKQNPTSYDCQLLANVLSGTEGFRAAIEAAGTLAFANLTAALHRVNVTTLAGPFRINSLGQNYGRSYLVNQLRNNTLVPVASELPNDVLVPMVFPVPREPDTPGAPRVSVLSTGVIISYSVANKGSDNHTIYQIQAAIDSSTLAWKGVYNGTSTTVLLTNLIVGLTYRFRVRAFNSVGASAYSTDVATLFSPPIASDDGSKLAVKIAVPIAVVAAVFLVIAAVAFAYARRMATAKVSAAPLSLDLDGPVSKALKVIEKLKKNKLKGSALAAELRVVEDALIASNMYQPELDSDAADHNIGLETVQFLDTLLMTRLMPDKHNASKRRPSHKDQSLSNMSNGVSRMNAGERDVSRVLESIGRWDFNIFTLEAATSSRPLCALAIEVLWKLGLIDEFALDDMLLKRFLLSMEMGYANHNAPYHTSTHAADVLQAMFVFFQQDRFRALFSPREMLAACLACIGHDLDHPGVTNSFMIATGHELALLYNDVAVLENHHCASLFKVLQDPDANILRNLDSVDLRAVRKLICTLILATDVAQHFEHVAKFKARMGPGHAPVESDADRALVLVMAIKCADVSNPTKRMDVYNGWTDRIMEEFYRQGDRERELGLPVSMFMDRQNPCVEKCQNGFIEVIVSPLFKAFTEFIEFDEPRVNMERNHAFWKRKLEIQPVSTGSDGNLLRHKSTQSMKMAV